MRHVGRTLALLAALISAAGWAQNNTLQDVRVWAAPDRTRVVFDLTGPFKHDMFRLENPDRLVVDVPDARRAEALAKDFEGKGFVRQVRSGVRNGDDLRLVLDLAEPVAPNMFTLEPNQKYGHRLVLDLENGASNPQRQPEATEPHYGGREFVVAIDAGHGGEDPGAVGPSGTREKDIVLKISRELERLIAAEPGMRPVMIRNGDYYVGLRERMDKAREARADLFISVHADAFRDRRAKGSSVYVLSRSGATSEHARWLAEQENAADLVGGVTLRNKDADLASFMLDLSQGASIEASLDVGGRVLREIRQINDLHKHEVQQAGFLVLKSPDIPSLLVETAFISNPGEERELRDGAHRRQLAQAMLSGIRDYVASYRPGDGRDLARARMHEVRPGETLSGIAARYGVSVADIRQANQLSRDVIRIGAELRIPPPSDAQVTASAS
ncbi:N-acetylmuramoyl-L-alanine amidase [Salinisphaera sp. P385]|uniref:N-acetylmuramoyl-L-alanine amidase n=1 Tax=Spectribacter acetivorans TaxID=3075603 RepID=A0ABU3B5J6_9GAMM|nr:N-acetylmuramoyl-L-alanine amidase [Salinisphaera sp. P385]MDT0617737.1 N-acetylmuramoyl-L-alanine amidase [Salinisphaera sp. P385]